MRENEGLTGMISDSEAHTAVGEKTCGHCGQPARPEGPDGWEGSDEPWALCCAGWPGSGP